MKLLCVSLVALMASSAAYAADLPTKKGTPVAPKKPNCFSDFFSYLNASPTDCPLSLYGITLFGTIDIGGGWQSEAAPFNRTQHTGVEELIGKQDTAPRWQLVPNGLSQSTIGIKVEEQLVKDWAVIADYDFGFDPYSLQLASGPGAQLQNNGIATPLQSSNADSSRAGQFDNGQLYGGMKSTYFGTLIGGRVNSLTLDGVNAYDPMGGSYAFSVIGWSGTTAGVGDTEDARSNSALKYRIEFNHIRFGALEQIGGYAEGNGSNAQTQLQFGGDIYGFSGDVIWSYVKDAVSAANFTSAPFVPNSLKATLSNDESVMLLGKYTWKPVTFYGGFEAIRFMNSSRTSTAPFNGIDGIYFSSVTTTAYTIPKNLYVFWGGAKYAVLDNLDLTGAYYHYTQPDYSGTGCSTSAKGSCQGYLNAVSGLIDWRPYKRLDVYAGAMYSQVSGGLANGYTKTSTVDPTVGLRFRF